MQNPKTIFQHIKDNKLKLITFLIGYILFVTDSKQLEGFQDIFHTISPLLFGIFYVVAISISYIYIKVSIKFFRKIKIDTNNKKETFFQLLQLIFLGSLLGFFVNILQALIVTTFDLYIIG